MLVTGKVQPPCSLPAGGDDCIRKPLISVCADTNTEFAEKGKKQTGSAFVEGVVLDLVFGQLCYEDRVFNCLKRIADFVLFVQNYPSP